MPNTQSSPARMPQHTHLADINPDTAESARDAGRVTDVPDSQQRPITFNSAA